MTAGATEGGPLCRRRSHGVECGVRRDSHVGEGVACPRLKGCSFLGHAPRPNSAANTFAEGEINLLDVILKTLLRGGDAGTLTRSPDFAGVMRKVQAMKSSIERRKAGK